MSKAPIAPALKPCAACPWRKSNMGKRHAAGWYTRANLKRLWQGLRTGDAPGMTCHPTDSDNPQPPGSKPVPAGVETRECAGSLLLIVRELRAMEADPDAYFGDPDRRKNGITKAGARWWAIARCHFAGVPMVGGPPIPLLDEDPDIIRPDHLPSRVRA